MQISVATNVSVPPALGFSDLMKYAGQVANVEGKNLYMHVAKMSTAAGDLAATAASDIGQPKEHTYEEVADLMLRAAIFGLAHGMNPNDLSVALGSATERLVRDGLATKVEKLMESTGFNLSPTLIIDPRQ